MSTKNTLANLKDIHLPAEISLWPPAPGWWLIGFIVFLMILFFSHWMWIRYKFKKPKIEALKILKNIQQKYHKNNDQQKTLSELSCLIRRVSLTFYKKEEVAPLYGFEWLKFLDATGHTSEFTKGEGSILGVEIYKKNTNINIDSLFHIVNRWINKVKKEKIK